ncbi:MAG: hypothetical protein ACRCX7_04270 [Cetobacterium sp.]|uniref:hypothetical protein n=1 Tax=Cetobacterium sp. TaxID=2071632 RepID=UPI003F3D02AA
MKKNLLKSLVVVIGICSISAQTGVIAMADTSTTTPFQHTEMVKMNDLSVETFDLNSEESRIHMQNQSAKAGENWVVQSVQTLKSNVILSSKCGDTIAKDVTSSKTTSFNLGVSGSKTLHGIKLSGTGGFSYSKSHTFFGPRGNVPLANNSNYGYLTHNVSVGIVKGDIKKYTYKVYDKYSGKYLRTEVKTNALKKDAFSYTLGVQELSSTKVEKANGRSYRTYSSFTSFRNTINKAETASGVLY